jgi:molecular chaperone GrpE
MTHRGDPRRQSMRRRREDTGSRRVQDRHEDLQVAPPPGESAIEAVDEAVESGVPVLEDAGTGVEDEIAELKDQLKRLQAEFDNYRKRQAREFHRLCEQGKRDLITDLLPVLDNIDRAREHRDQGTSSEEILPGLFQTMTQLDSVLAKEGLSGIPLAPMDQFDPNLHEAVIAEDYPGIDHDVVLEVLRRGYYLEQELLRPTLVKVGRTVRPPVQEAEGEV